LRPPDQRRLYIPCWGGYDKWYIKADEIKLFVKCKIKVSTIPEGIATPEQRAKALDIADYMIEKWKTKTSEKQIQSPFTPELQSMIEKNKSLLVLLNNLALEEL